LRGQSWCRRILRHCECQGIIFLRLSCYGLSIRSIFRRALTTTTDQYKSGLILGLLCWPLNHMPCLPELYYSEEILFRNWQNSTGVVVWVPGHCGISISAFVGPEPRKWLLKSHCTSKLHWRLLKKSTSSLTIYFLRLPGSKLRILV
jgi:hypothetical protein